MSSIRRFCGSALVIAVGCSSSSDGGTTVSPDGGEMKNDAGVNPADATQMDGGVSVTPEAAAADAPASNGDASCSCHGPTIGACPVFPIDSEWNRDITGDPVDPNSDAYIAKMNGATKHLHPDFGSNALYGIPWIMVDASQAKVPMTFTYASESDPGPYPFPATAPIEGGPNGTGDRHVIVVDTSACKLYETFNSHFTNPGWQCDSGALFDLLSKALRPDGWTSADAAGLPILPGLARLSEVKNQSIAHALRFTMATTQMAYVHPATHYASSNTDPSEPPMGLRVRLKQSFDLSTFTGESLVILKALTQYGMFVADNGSDWFISGETNTAWDDNDLAQIKTVPASAFEVVKLGTIQH